MPTVIKPQLAVLVDKPPTGKHWLHEIKFDGYRILAFKTKNKTRLVSRNNKDWTIKFKNIVEEINALQIENAIFDGEMLVFNDKRISDFQLLQNSIKSSQKISFFYYIFDLLYYEKYNLMNLPLIERKQILEMILAESSNHLRYSDHIIGSGKKMFEKSCELALEGIISKDSKSLYMQKRTKSWLKIKCINAQEFIIGGYTSPKGSRKHFGALLLGTYNKRKEFIYCGKVGTGFTEASLKTINAALLKNKSNENPFHAVPPESKKVSWVKPNLIAEIEFIEWTKEGHLRHPSFKGLRADKPAKNVSKETATPIGNIKPDINPAPGKAKLTNPHKILFPEDKISKRQVAEYYEKIAKWILPYIENRPLAIVRCPNGYKECFFQKHIIKGTPAALKGIAIKEKAGNEKTIYLDSHAGLMTLPQLGVLEIHPWNCRIDDIEYPDMLIFDLDPDPEVTWDRVVNAANDIKNHFKQLKMKSFVKTTGGKDLHVVIPIKPYYDWQEIKNFSHQFVDFMVMQKPHEYVGQMTKAKRKGKIYIDYLRNQRGATAIAPYSLRARIHAPVATPIAWTELTSEYADTFYTINTLPERLEKLKKDPWSKFYSIKQSLPLIKKD